MGTAAEPSLFPAPGLRSLHAEQRHCLQFALAQMVADALPLHGHYQLVLAGGAAFSALTDQQPGGCLVLLGRLPGSCLLSAGWSISL